MILHRTPLVALLAFPKSNMREKKKGIVVLVVKIASCIQSLMGFRVPWTVFRFPKPRIPDSTNKTDIPDSRIPIHLHGAIKEVIVQNCKWFIAMKRNKMDGNLPNTTYRRDLICWGGGVCTSLSLNVSDMWDGFPPEYLKTSRNNACIFNHKSDLFFSARRHSGFFAVTTVA